jgi:hypothetical protein
MQSTPLIKMERMSRRKTKSSIISSPPPHKVQHRQHDPSEHQKARDVACDKSEKQPNVVHDPLLKNERGKSPLVNSSLRTL